MPDFAGKKKEKLPAKAASRVDFFADFLITRQQSWTRYQIKIDNSPFRLVTKRLLPLTNEAARLSAVHEQGFRPARVRS